MSTLPPRTAKTSSNPRRVRASLPVIAGAILIGLIVIGLWPRPIAVEIVEVKRGPLVVTVDEEGMTRVRNRYIVSTPVGGQLRRIDWKPGADVVAGQTVLATIETSEADFLDARRQAQAQLGVRAAEAARDSALARRAQAAAAARVASTEFERAGRLRNDGVLSPQEFDAIQARHESALQAERAADFAVKVAEHEWQQAQVAAGRGQPGPGTVEPLVIRAPVSGKLLRVFQESARVVPAGFALVEIGDATDLEVRIELLSRDAVAVAPGARVVLEQWGGPAPLQARVRLVEPSAFTKISALGVEEQRVYAIADFIDPLERRPNLGDSYRVEARIVVWETADAILAPAGAVFHRGAKPQVFVLEGGRARLRDVEISRSNGTQTEIRGGLQPGDRVIVYPGDKVSDGTRVRSLQIETR